MIPRTVTAEHLDSLNGQSQAGIHFGYLPFLLSFLKLEDQPM